MFKYLARSLQSAPYRIELIAGNKVTKVDMLLLEIRSVFGVISPNREKPLYVLYMYCTFIKDQECFHIFGKVFCAGMYAAASSA